MGLRTRRRTRTWLLTPVIVACALGVAFADDKAGPPAGEQPEVVTLREAALAGDVKAEGFQPSSYRRVHLRVSNRTDRSLAVDLCGSHLRPKKRGSCQRLGIGPPVTPSEPPTTPPSRPIRRDQGMVVMYLEPGEEQEVQLNTCCLDAGRSAPGSQTFSVAKAELPPVREKVLRWWADNPTVPQSAVNAAIWQFRDTVHVGQGVVETYTEPAGKFVAAHGGTIYRLSDGELMSRDEQGIERFLGTEIFQVIPVEGAIYAVALGPDRRPDLWRHSITGEPWGFVMDLNTSERILDIIPGANGNLVLVTDQGVRFWNKAANTLTTSLATEQILHLSTRQAGQGRLTAIIQRPPEEAIYRAGSREGEKAPVFELWSVDLATGKSERAKEFWNVKAMRAGPGGIFGLSHRGRLRQLVRRSFRDVGTEDPYERILTVTRKRLWLVTPKGHLAAVSTATGRRLRTYDLKPGMFKDLKTDAYTGDLVFVHADGWHRIRAATGAVEAIPSPQ